MVKRIIVIGGGLSGAITAAEILKGCEQPANVTLLELDSTRMGGGIPYGSGTADSFHETNTAASVMISGLSASPENMLAVLKTPANKIMPRKMVGQAMLRELFGAVNIGKKKNVTLSQHFGEAVKVTDYGHKVTVETSAGAVLEADRVVIATGNIQEKHLPVLKDQRQDEAFMARYVENQWTREGREKISNIPLDAPVLIVGTALSAYDAARSLIHKGHTGKITLMSRHGFEHYQYPEQHDWPSVDLPRPRFIDMLSSQPAAALQELYAEFEELTGLQIDAEKGVIGPEDWRQKYATMPCDNYMPKQVLGSWEKHIPEVIDIIGVENYGHLIKQFSSLINVMRIGAGYAVCQEIEEAKARGQLSVIKADIDDLQACPQGVFVTCTQTETGDCQEIPFHTVISSLGPNHDYSHPTSPLWQDIISKGYTTPHPVGVGVRVAFEKGAGALPGSDNIFVAGTPASGELMTREGLFGPAAFGAPDMHDNTVRTACNVLKSLNR